MPNGNTLICEGMAGRVFEVNPDTTIASREFGSGLHSVEWAGRSREGRAVPSGTYLERMETDGSTESRKISLVR